jgi:hypothetical protein
VSRDSTVWFVVPASIDDPERVSGGNVYDRHVREGLREQGWDLRTIEAGDAAGVSSALVAISDPDIVLIDGLVAGWAPGAVESLAGRARVVVLAHMVAAAFGDVPAERARAERRVLACATTVIATSGWTAAELASRRLVDEARIAVAVPGSQDGPAGAGASGDLLCVGVLAPHKGQDLLLAALRRLPARDWTCTVAGSATVDPSFAARISAGAAQFGSRVRLTGVLDAAGMDAAYQRSGVLVAPSRVESFGIAIADARRRGIPVIAAAVGGIPDTVADGGAILVPPGDPIALARALDRWMIDPDLRARLRSEADSARSRAPRWSDTIARIDDVLAAS